MKHVFFDLDGTLTDPRDGIVACIRHAMATLGRELPSPHELERFIGPPLFGTFRTLLADPDEETIERAITAYRERFATVGIFENRVYAGIPDALATLQRTDHRLYLVTVKPAPFAARILEHFGIAGHFASVHAPDLADRSVHKASLIRRALEAHDLDPATVTMVGDRAEDIAGARRNGVMSVAVTWGYGSSAELEAAQPDELVHSVSELLAFMGAAAATTLSESETKPL